MTEQTSTASKPSHRLYVITGEGKSAKWTEIGAAWPNKDGKGFSISSPLGGRIVMREAKARAPKKETA